MINKNKKLDMALISNFFFLFFSIMDPTRNIFHFTEISLLFFLVFNYKKICWEYLPVIIFCISVYFISLSFAITNQVFDTPRELSLLTSYVFLFYILFSKATGNKTFLYFYKLGIAMSIIVIIIAMLFLLFNQLALIFINFLVDKKGTIMFTNAKRFLSFTIIGVFYRTSPMITLLLPFSLERYYSTKKRKYLFHSVLFASNLLLSGTRANILSAILLLGFIFLFHLWFNRKSLFAFPIFTIIILFAAVVLILLIILTKDASSSVKDLHRESEIEVLFANPIRTFFVGYGPGSKFYTKAWGRTTSQTELSYFEIIRNYGLIGGGGILLIFFYPLFLMLRTLKYSVLLRCSLSLGYLAYLFIAGTNPFLNCATGYLTVSIFYYMANVNILDEMECI